MVMFDENGKRIVPKEKPKGDKPADDNKEK